MITDESMVGEVEESLAELNTMGPEDRQLVVAEQQASLDDRHAVDYLNACLKESFEHTKDRREKDVELWHAHESIMEELADKEDWQSQIVLNQPFSTVQHASAIVRRGLFGRADHMFLEPHAEQDPNAKLKVNFWRRALKFWGNRPEADRRLKFVDASRYGFAMGLSSALKYSPGMDKQGRMKMEILNVEPWKLFYDPKTRRSRNPQSGLYAIHQEEVDLHEMMAMGELGLYQNTELLPGSGSPVDEASEFAQHAREFETEDGDHRHQIYKNPFRKQVTVREFYGALLDKDGVMLMPHAHFMTANDILIVPPHPIPFPTIKWPWVDFSPLPHPSKYHGYGLYQGTMGLWRFMSTLLNLYIDNENFRINEMYEIDEDALKNPELVEFMPGARFAKKPGHPGQAINPVKKAGSNLADIQMLWQIANQGWQEGTNVNQFVSGQTGDSGKMTATELNIKTQQAMGVLDSQIGRDVEDGYVEVIKVEQEFLQTYWNPVYMRYYDNAFASDPLYQLLATNEMMPQDRMAAMSLEADVRVYGISRAFEKAQVAQELLGLVQLSQQPTYQPYAKNYETFKKYADMIDQPELVKTEDELRQEMLQQQIMGIKDKALAAAGLLPGPAQGPEAGPGNEQRPPNPASQGQGGPPPSQPTATNPGDIPAHL